MSAREVLIRFEVCAMARLLFLVIFAWQMKRRVSSELGREGFPTTKTMPNRSHHYTMPEALHHAANLTGC
jgi:hypothetical protein